MMANPLLQQTGRTWRSWPRHATYCGRLLSSRVVSQRGTLLGAMVLAVVLSLAACGKPSEPADTSPTPANPSLESLVMGHTFSLNVDRADSAFSWMPQTVCLSNALASGPAGRWAVTVPGEADAQSWRAGWFVRPDGVLTLVWFGDTSYWIELAAEAGGAWSGTARMTSCVGDGITVPAQLEPVQS